MICIEIYIVLHITIILTIALMSFRLSTSLHLQCLQIRLPRHQWVGPMYNLGITACNARNVHMSQRDGILQPFRFLFARDAHLRVWVRVSAGESNLTFLFTVGILCHVECYIRQLLCSSIISHNITSIVY